MKTAEQWTEEYFQGTPEEIGDCFAEHVKHVNDIKLEAYRYGMEQAARMCDARLKEIVIACRSPWTLDWQEMIKAINVAAKTAQLP